MSRRQQVKRKATGLQGGQQVLTQLTGPGGGSFVGHGDVGAVDLEGSRSGGSRHVHREVSRSRKAVHREANSSRRLRFMRQGYVGALQ
jgi:hypothetical protein